MPPRLSAVRYLLGGNKRLRVETLNDSDTVQESMACTQSPISPSQPDYGRLPDNTKPTTLQNHLEKHDRKNLKLCRAFVQ